MTPTDHPTTPARARTRRAVLQAAARLFAERGFHGASMQSIAEAAGYTQGAIYANFGGKAELFLAVVDDRMETRTAEVDAELAGHGGSERLERANAVGHERLRDDGGEQEVLLGLEFLLYVVREAPALRRALAERHLAADEVTRRTLREVEPALTDADPGAVRELALVHSLLFEGLKVRLLADPDLLRAEEAAALVRRTMDAAGSALVAHAGRDDGPRTQ